ncbi:MAG: hypothetical protein WKF84_25115 [Pyrinomonadaceae bacterium]
MGLGETFDEVVELMKDLRSVSCDIMTIGQYLQPHARRLPVERYVTPEEFNRWRDIGMQMGFRHVESRPAHALFRLTMPASKTEGPAAEVLEAAAGVNPPDALASRSSRVAFFNVSVSDKR